MKILIVATDYFNESNGLCISTQRFIKCFKEYGHEVRVATNNRNGQSEYPLDVYKVPVFHGIIEKEGYTFAKNDEKVLTEAINWCDIVHLEDPFPLGKFTSKLAEKLNKPCTATFHLYPENMTYAANIHWLRLDGMFMRYFRSSFERCILVQCPTEIVMNRLQKFKFKNELVVVSNGITEDSIQKERLEKPEELKNKFVILSTGRYSREKNQQELIRALAKSKYKNDIKVILAGKGPLDQKLKKLSSKLKIDVDYNFYTQNDLKAIRGYADLYVHCAKVEVEGMACMEAFSSGCVPVIAKNKLSSTWIYGIGDNNIYKSNKPKELASKIDYWFENKDTLEEYRLKYVDLGEQLTIKKSADAMLGHFQRVIENFNKNK